MVAVRGDPDSPVNRGLLCVKGYALPQIQYGEDRLTRPLLRMKDGKFDKKGDFQPVSWEQAFDVMEREWRRAHGELGPTGVGIMGSGQYLIQDGARTWPRCTPCSGRASSTSACAIPITAW